MTITVAGKRQLSLHTKLQPSFKEGIKNRAQAARINSRAKGSAGEREFSGKILELLGVKLVRKLDQTRGGGHDLELAKGQDSAEARAIGRFAFECKRYGLVTEGKIREWWKQAVEQGEKAGLIPALAYRENRGSWRVIVPLNCLCPGIAFHESLDLTTEMSVEGFSVFVREVLV